ncbi:hypothetical protein LOTGIDRAFT_232289 [Lottia gigantea]|uniref:NACHT domain-containing protein n=1 Tax=Lottia gigantea TaxID=225164 RepID=V3ZSL1_LOTGI|nr:hypothetical protein LOTGIDRAFT_232289 [Lottia gigantea]ESO94433.1 hypothetical protein LOTGIDRAFT_232289 [Lottia gigantea]
MACAATLVDELSIDTSPPSRESITTVKLFVTSYSDEFYAERDVIKREVLPEVRLWCEKKKLNLVEQSVKWGGRHPDCREVGEMEKVQTSIENCYYNNIMPLFINLTSESIGWVPMWGEYSDEVIEDYIEAYGLLVEDLESHRIINYKAEYRGVDHKRRPLLRLSDEIKQQIINFLIARIGYEFCGEDLPINFHPDNQTLSEQRDFLSQRCQNVHGRSDVVKKIEDYILRDEKDVPLLLLGTPGSGKTSIMCKAVEVVIQNLTEHHQARSEGKPWHVFYHFVGAVPGSTSLEPMLKRLLREMEVVKDSNMPKDLDTTAQMCCSMLSNPNTKPVVIFIDAINQIKEDKEARVISWIPRKLAPEVRIIISTINNTFHHKSMMSRETKPIELNIKPLDHLSRKEIIKDILRRYNKSLTERQINRFLRKASSDNPLWLSIACEELQLVNDIDLIDDKIESLPDGLVNILEELLTRLEQCEHGQLLVATLCLLEASVSGLLESELRFILGDTDSLTPPSPYDEKDEKECSEKEKAKKCGPLSDKKWIFVFTTLKPFLRPYGDSKDGRLDFYHRALSKAVRKKYFCKKDRSEDVDVDEVDTDIPDVESWWHLMLADYFEKSNKIDRIVEEYPYHLVELKDKYRLAQCLCDWKVFDKLYNEEFSSVLLAHWRAVGPTSEMLSHYERELKSFERDENINEEAVSMRYEKVCRVVIQSGKHHEALELLKTAMKIEERELGARPHRMVELFALMAEIYDEKLKMNDFVSPCQLPDLRKTIYYGRKSICLRRTLPGPYHKFKVAMSLMKLAFNMESWEACGGAPELSDEDALIEGNKYIDKALKIFQELNDMGHYAEALMTKGVLATRGSMEQLKWYNEAMDLCMQMYGEYHILTSRLYINIGIVYEDNDNYNKAYEYFKKWARVSEEILGPDHPKTQRAKGVLRETRYKRIAQQQGEWEEEESSSDSEESGEEVENPDIEHNYDDSVSHVDMVNNIAIDQSMNSVASASVFQDSNQSASEGDIQGLSGDNANEGYSGDPYEEDGEESVDEEHTDSENFYDDNFEAYNEHYALHAAVGPVIEEFNLHLDDDDEDDYEIVELASTETDDTDVQFAGIIDGLNDNRFDDGGAIESDEIGNECRYINSSVLQPSIPGRRFSENLSLLSIEASDNRFSDSSEDSNRAVNNNSVMTSHTTVQTADGNTVAEFSAASTNSSTQGSNNSNRQPYTNLSI